MAQVRWSLTAAEDLRAIEAFIARDSPLYAIRLTDQIVEAKAFQTLEPGHPRPLRSPSGPCGNA
jgi:plasmid stabilization system protein ParE